MDGLLFAEDTYHQAKRFQAAFDILTGYINDIGQINKNILNLGVPALVNSAFSSELFLKCIIDFETGHRVKGNTISSLFRKLPEEPRIFIINSICKLPDFKENSFDQYIDNVSEIFAKWRYLHEGIESGSVGTPFLMALVSASDSYVI